MENSAAPSTTALLSDYDLEFRDDSTRLNSLNIDSRNNSNTTSAAFGESGPTTTSPPEVATTDNCPIVEIIAPAPLKEGYTFDVEANGNIFTVVVPQGGVKSGQVFRVQTQTKIDDTFRIQTNAWKDGFFDLCRHGPFHSSCMLALCCPLLGLGQIMTRLNLTWYITPASTPPPAKKSFRIMLLITLLYILFASPITRIFYLFTIFLAAFRMRSYLRHKYSIPPYLYNVIPADDPRFSWIPVGVIEDGCLSCICRPCVISQMSRHTAMYDTYDGACCTSSGLPNYAPFMV